MHGVPTCHAKRTEASLKRAFAEVELAPLRIKCLPECEAILGAAVQQTDYLTPLGREPRSARSADSLCKYEDVHQTLRHLVRCQTLRRVRALTLLPKAGHIEPEAPLSDIVLPAAQRRERFVLANVRAKLPAEACVAWPRKENSTPALERPSNACRSGSA